MNWRSNSDFAAAPEASRWIARFPHADGPDSSVETRTAPPEPESPLDSVLNCADPRFVRFRSHPSRPNQR